MQKVYLDEEGNTVRKWSWRGSDPRSNGATLGG